MSASSVVTLLRSLLAMLVATGVLVAGIWLSGEIAAWLRLPAGGDGRLAWDLGGIVVPSAFAFAVAAHLAPRAPAAHVSALMLLLLAVTLWGVWTMGADYPAWFSAGLLVLPPLAAGLAIRRLRRGRRGRGA